MPLALAVAGANRHDMKLAEETLAAIPVPRPVPTEDEPLHLCLDKGYDYYPEVHELVEAWGYMAHIARRGVDQQARLPGTALGGGAHPRLAQPLPAFADPLGEEAGLPGPAAPGLRLDDLPRRRGFRMGIICRG